MFKDKPIFTRFDLSLPDRIWNEVKREGDICNSFRCHFSQICPFQNAKREWADSDILIMNHYLFFTNVAFDKLYIPDTDIVIFDEAHSVENIGAAQLGFKISNHDLLEILGLFYTGKKRNQLINNISSAQKRKDCIELIKDIQKESSVFFEHMKSKSKGRELRITEPLPVGEILSNNLKRLNIILQDTEADFVSDEFVQMEFDIFRGKLFLYTENFRNFIYHSKDNFVYWIESIDRDLLAEVNLRGQPIDITETMYSEVMTYYTSNIFISATLTINKDFSFIEKRLNVINHKTLLLESTFNFKEQVKLYISSNLDNAKDTQFIQK